MAKRRGEPDDQARILEAVREARRAAEARRASKGDPSEPEEESEEPAAVLRAFPLRRDPGPLAPRVPAIEIPEAPEVEPIGPIEVVIAEPVAPPKRGRGTPSHEYSRKSIATVLRLWTTLDEGDTRRTLNAIARNAQVTRHVVRRVIRLYEHGVLTLGPRGGLRVSQNRGNLRQAPASLSLRALEAAHGLKPLR